MNHVNGWILCVGSFSNSFLDLNLPKFLTLNVTRLKHYSFVHTFFFLRPTKKTEKDDFESEEMSASPDGQDSVSDVSSGNPDSSDGHPSFHASNELVASRSNVHTTDVSNVRFSNFSANSVSFAK